MIATQRAAVWRNWIVSEQADDSCCLLDRFTAPRCGVHFESYCCDARGGRQLHSRSIVCDSDSECQQIAVVAAWRGEQQRRRGAERTVESTTTPTATLVSQPGRPGHQQQRGQLDHVTTRQLHSTFSIHSAVSKMPSVTYHVHRHGVKGLLALRLCVYVCIKYIQATLLHSSLALVKRVH